MANEEHLAILRQGVEIWNKWRNENSEIIPDLSGNIVHSWYYEEIKIKGIKFDKGIHVSEARQLVLLPNNLTGVSFKNANLNRADFRNLDLREADLSNANLSGVCLNDANLTDANLSGSLINGTNLTRANLSNADLSGAGIDFTDFTEVNLKGTKFARVKFSVECIHLSQSSPRIYYKLKFNLREANLSEANFSGFDLSEANLSGVNLDKANLIDTNLTGTNLSEASLRGADLTRVQALSTNFTLANLSSACIEDWNINSATNLNGVNCEYLYLRQNKQERRPSSGNFAPGEFTKLFQKSLETIDLIFCNGIDWDAFAYSFKKVEVENQGAQLDVQSIEKKGDGILVVRVSVYPDADKAKIHSDFMQGYEFAHKALEAQYQARLGDKDKEINRLFYLLDKANEQLGEVPKLLAKNPGKISNYYQQNSQFAGGVVDAETVQSQQIGGDICNKDNQKSLD